jgi:glycosyltransferase involved in cell wall biosynthesis
MAAAYAAMDVLVLPSAYEGLPLSLIEAMAMGVPVVGTNVTGISDIVRHRETGLLVPRDDTGALASGVIQVFDDRTLRASLSHAARVNVMNNYSRQRMVRDVEAVYHDAMANKPQ